MAGSTPNQCRRYLDCPMCFELRAAVTSYGYYQLAPHIWQPHSSTFSTVVPYRPGESVLVSVSDATAATSAEASGPKSTAAEHARGVKPARGVNKPQRFGSSTRTARLGPTSVSCDPHLSASVGNGPRLALDIHPPTAEAATVAVNAVRRQLRLEESLREFHEQCRARRTVTAASKANDPGGLATDYSQAAEQRFGRMLRGPNLFCDIVYTMLTCNITWAQTRHICQRLVAFYGAPVNPSATNGASVHDLSHAGTYRAMPTPETLAALTPDTLQQVAGCGYRAGWLVNLAREVVNGRLDLAKIEQLAADPACSTLHLQKALQEIRGIGPYASANLAVLLGRYDQLPIDTEMRRHARQHITGGRTPTDDQIRRHYAPFGKHAFLAYWWDLTHAPKT